jgi:uncharacterized repeat protein (TIGR01451 family)
MLTFSLLAYAEVKAEMKAELITVEAGKEVRSSAAKAAPGDTVQYTAVYRNTDKTAATNVIATLPIPPATAYVSGSATPAGAMATLDGTNFAPIPLKRKVKNAQGVTVEEIVPASEYKALRWNLETLAGSESRTVSARVKVR